MVKRQVLLAVAVLLLAAPTFAADRTIQSGIDLWLTKGDGSTYADFSINAIPAGFFCSKSAPFTGRVAFRGTPIATDSPEALAKADTIVHRLDDAVFNRRGKAVTRIQLAAMTFESVAPIQTECGAFDATLRLDGQQPITRMIITRENKYGGRFSAPIHANVKIAFTPVGRTATEVLEIPIQVRFPPLANQRWASPDNTRVREVPGFVRIDTDGDRVTDTFVPGTSNFVAGFTGKPGRGGAVNLVQEKYEVPAAICHEADCGQHCPAAIYPGDNTAEQ